MFCYNKKYKNKTVEQKRETELYHQVSMVFYGDDFGSGVGFEYLSELNMNEWNERHPDHPYDIDDIYKKKEQMDKEAEEQVKDQISKLPKFLRKKEKVIGFLEVMKKDEYFTEAFSLIRKETEEHELTTFMEILFSCPPGSRKMYNPVGYDKRDNAVGSTMRAIRTILDEKSNNHNNL